jgi:hypothetical protein
MKRYIETAASDLLAIDRKIRAGTYRLLLEDGSVTNVCPSCYRKYKRLDDDGAYWAGLWVCERTENADHYTPCDCCE